MRVTRLMSVALCLGCQLLLTATVLPADEVLRSRFEAANQGFSIQFGQTPLLMPEPLRGFYAVRHYELIWITEEGGLRPAAETLLTAIRDVGSHGLIPEDYHLTPIEQRLAELHEANEDSLAIRDLDMLLSDAFLLLATHLQRGKTDPRVIDPQWDGLPPETDWLLQKTAELDDPVTQQSLSRFLADRLPRDPGYQRLVAARQKLVSLSRTGDWKTLESGPLLRPGNLDKRVPDIRERLMQWGDLSPLTIDMDGTDPDPELYTEDLATAVMAFQDRHGLAADGVIGPETIAALNVSPAERVNRIDVNLERWRWMPAELGERHVLVNIAGFEMRLVDSGQPVLVKPVVVGRDYRRTPVFSDRIRYLVLNPEWVVPPKLAVEDKLPEIRSNPDYLQRLGFRVYNGWGADREVIDPTTVDWNAVTARNFPYRLVQEPGPMNALGQIKFMFPNQYNVYLHDTPSRELFRRPERAFSSGCVRVQDPAELAALLLAAEGWTGARLDAALAAGRTETVVLKSPVPVHIQYWTAWVDDNGTLHFRKDLYNRDDAIFDAIGHIQE
jgi:L,D-transpeptidase YcbB